MCTLRGVAPPDIPVYSLVSCSLHFAMATSNVHAPKKGSINPHLDKLSTDFLYHIGYSRDELKGIFSDVKFVVMGGSAKRMGMFAEVIAKAIGHPKKEMVELDISKSDRFSFYKIGPVLSVNHGMGVPSVTILLHEILKLLYYAEAKDPIIFRLGTCGGLGLSPGSVVITNKAVNAFLKEHHETVILGRTITRPAILDQELAESLLATQTDNTFNTLLGTTMCTDDFYEGQARIDGVLCEHGEEEKQKYLEHINSQGVVNIEMEATAIASLCHRTGYRCAIVCVTLLDRLQGDQVDISPETYKKYQARPQELIANFIKKRLREDDIKEEI